jgi:hypothetical protein
MNFLTELKKRTHQPKIHNSVAMDNMCVLFVLSIRGDVKYFMDPHLVANHLRHNKLRKGDRHSVPEISRRIICM